MHTRFGKFTKSIGKREVGNMPDLIINNSEMSAVLEFESTLTH